MNKVSVGIITIHRIFNYGSIFQAYALQHVCNVLNMRAEIIDYIFPNSWQVLRAKAYEQDWKSKDGMSFICSLKHKFLKFLFCFALYRQHREMRKCMNRFLVLSSGRYASPGEIKQAPPKYDVYMSGSDQIWNPRYCKCDPAFLLHFAPEEAVKVAYGSSFGVNSIEGGEEKELYRKLLQRFSHISVREQSGVDLVRRLSDRNASLVLDPTLLLDEKDWDSIATSRRLVNEKYILCYYLNYSFNAFPYVNKLADYIRKYTGWKIVYMARPPHRVFNPGTIFKVGASPAEFLALIRDAELVLTTSFHGTAFAVNYNRPLYSVVSDRNASDSRQVNLLNSLGLSHRILSIHEEFPEMSDLLDCPYIESNKRLEELRQISINYLSEVCQQVWKR
jgi:hypothetical protein